MAITEVLLAAALEKAKEQVASAVVEEGGLLMLKFLHGKCLDRQSKLLTQIRKLEEANLILTAGMLNFIETFQIRVTDTGVESRDGKGPIVLTDPILRDVIVRSLSTIQKSNPDFLKDWKERMSIISSAGVTNE